MKKFIVNNNKSLLVIASCLLTGAITMSFQNQVFGPLQKLDAPFTQRDSIPENQNCGDTYLKMKEYNKLMEELDKELKKAKEGLAKTDVERIKQEIQISMDKIDIEKIQLSIEQAMKAVDLTAIQNEVTRAIKKADCEKLDAEVKASLEAARKEMSEINMDGLKQEMEKAKIEIEQGKLQLAGIDMEKIMKQAGEGIRDAAKELRQTKAMFNEMEDGFSIEFRNGSLYINDKKQNETITNKYRNFIGRDDYKIIIDKE
jgi:uncharacterized protein YukE